MGYLPEEEMSYKQSTAKAAEEQAALRSQYEVRADECRGDLCSFVLKCTLRCGF